MNYSFTQPHKKSLFFQDTQIWGLFITVSLIILFGFDHLINLETKFVQENTLSYRLQSTSVSEDSLTIKQNIETLHGKLNFVEKIHSNNMIVKDSIENLFDLIPEQITLTNIKMTSTKLVLKGITPTKDIYKFLLSIPLKSIFEESTVTFYLADNGWYKFVSINLFEKDKK
jgi:ribosomal protein L23